MEYQTIYGKIVLLDENGVKKIDFKNSNFNSVMDFVGFLNNSKLTFEILGY